MILGYYLNLEKQSTDKDIIFHPKYYYGKKWKIETKNYHNNLSELDFTFQYDIKFSAKSEV